ncbi:ABC transporter ATP-binding protein [Chitinasiproducens palmae]|uniref:NitT/TauT family transport system ATP-binding protein n=1 Tax=Chitinasiproducens palmae TaxID=1770053 RepID=A0A1H2PU48_9BURK|nr:ABC transporter ATP-binding protein [Chitinasiproducens palmae]SDV50690.1 NitT/TauT family transport system ATP-binding protein [Chitinasiproducens palmae]
MLQINHLNKSYATEHGLVHAVGDVSFGVARGEFLAIVGSSGAGKTTLLRMLAGLLAPSAGQIVFDGQPVTAPPRAFAVVFQDYARSLFPWFSVQRNVELPLVNLIADRGERLARVEQMLGRVGLADHSRKRPAQLSGGQQQRVAIARALACQPEVLIMDEPFASVDAQTRNELEDLMLSIKQEAGTTVLFVTHDVDEAVYLGDRVLVLSRSPSTVAREVIVDLPAGRDQITTKALPAFAAARAAVLSSIVEQAAVPA